MNFKEEKTGKNHFNNIKSDDMEYLNKVKRDYNRSRRYSNYILTKILLFFKQIKYIHVNKRIFLD